MRYLCLYKPSRGENAPSTPEEQAVMGKLIAEMTANGTLVSTEGCQSIAKGARVRLSNGQYLVTDGPFVETKELIGGFAIINATSKEDAIEMTKRFLEIAGDGETEIRLLYEAGDPTCVTPEAAVSAHE
jgi:hypothetical protein